MLRHATIAELLEIRDGSGSEVARTHLERCEACRAELERLHQRRSALKALPGFTPPRDRWPLVRDAYVAARSRWRRRLVAWGAVAAAAALIGVIGVRAVSSGESAATADVESLVAESQQLEEVLRAYQGPGRVLDGVTAVAIADLEDRIAFIDYGIEQARTARVPRDAMADLWRQRVELMDRLVATHVRQVVYVGY